MQPEFSLGLYSITYQCGTRQAKHLVRHDKYVGVWLPTQDRIYDLERANKWKKTPESKALRAKLVQQFGHEWFTDESPLYGALITGVLSLPPHQGGDTVCKIEEIQTEYENVL